MAPLRRERTYINPIHNPHWPCQCPSVHIGSTRTHAHTLPLNTGSVIQSVKSIGWGGCATDRVVAKVSMPMKTAAMCTTEVRKGAIQWKGPCPIVPAERQVLQLLGPPSAQMSPHPCGWVEEQKWMTTQLSVLWSKRSLSSSSTRQLAPSHIQNHSSR